MPSIAHAMLSGGRSDPDRTGGGPDARDPRSLTLLYLEHSAVPSPRADPTLDIVQREARCQCLDVTASCTCFRRELASARVLSAECTRGFTMMCIGTATLEHAEVQKKCAMMRFCSEL